MVNDSYLLPLEILHGGTAIIEVTELELEVERLEQEVEALSADYEAHQTQLAQALSAAQAGDGEFMEYQ